MTTSTPFSAAARVACALLLGLTLTSGAALAQRAPAVDLDAMRTALKNKSAVVFDIREPSEHATGVADGARLLPMSQIGQRLAEIPKDQPVLLVCNTQNRSSKVAEALKQRGYSQVKFVNGGMSSWAQRGLPMVKPAR
ncbi:MAG: rhodanese-like domain-containing protein [Burkholderiales bacterium]|nr:rhodanese-like domain-containing protein [Burkholderiales bacterium]